MTIHLITALQAAAKAADLAPHTTSLTITREGLIVSAERFDIEYRHAVPWWQLDSDPEVLEEVINGTNARVTHHLGSVTQSTTGIRPDPKPRGSYAEVDAWPWPGQSKPPPSRSSSWLSPLWKALRR